MLTHTSVEPWNWHFSNISFQTNIVGCSGKHDTNQNIHAALDRILENIPEDDLIVYTDGSVGENNCNGGAGGFIKWPHNLETQNFMIPCGKKCTSYRAELSAMREVFKIIKDDDATLPSDYNIWLFIDSESSIERLQRGPGAQVDSLAGEIWGLLAGISKHHKIILQWIPGHRYNRK